jgi:hypothetical protein
MVLKNKLQIPSSTIQQAAIPKFQSSYSARFGSLDIGDSLEIGCCALVLASLFISCRIRISIAARSRYARRSSQRRRQGYSVTITSVFFLGHWL